MKINGQDSGINIGPISKLIFKYQELIRKFLKLFWIFTNFNWKYFFYHNKRVVEKPFYFLG